MDERTGEIHDYTHKRGVLHSEIVLPGGGTMARAELWNKVEKHHKRGDAVLVRELVIGLPTELAMAARQALAVGFANELSNRYGVAADVALHSPRTITDRDLEKNPDQYFEIDLNGWRNNANWHSHIMLSACHVFPDGALGKKAVEMDPIHCQRAKIENMVDWARARWAELVNVALEQAGESARVDHRTLVAQGITDRLPSVHLGQVGAGMKQRGKQSDIEIRENAKVVQFIADMEAAAAVQAQDDAEIAAIEAQLLKAKAEKAAAAELAPRTRAVVAAELEPLLATLKRSAEIEAVGSQRIKTAQPKVEIDAAKKAAPAVQKQAASARQRAAALTVELNKLPFWRFIRRFQVRRELPNVERLAKELAQKTASLLATAKADSFENAAAVLFESREAKRQALAKSRPLENELRAIESREAAETAAQAARNALQVPRAQKALQALQEALHPYDDDNEPKPGPVPRM